MKKLFTIFATFAMLCAVGCEEQGGGNEGTDIPDDAYISINKEVLTFSPDGESVDVKVYSNYEWKLTTTCDWVTTSISSGEASEGGTTITLSADLTYDDREGTIIFSCGKARKVLVVSQSFKEAIIADENNTFSVPAEGGNVIINYQTTVECEVIIPEEAKSWISLAPATRALVSESATLTVAENTTYNERSAVVKVVKVGDNSLYAEYTINQVQNDAFFADNNNTFNIKGWDQSINIAYQTNVECEVVIPEEAQSWISIAPKTRALVNESVTLNVADNNTGAARSAVVKVVAANNNELFAEYTITQNQRYFMEYTSTYGTVTPYDSSAFDATIIRNEYIDGKGYIDFDTPVTSIGFEAFRGCTSLTSIIIPDSVTSIGWAFWNCTSLTSVTIPDSVTSIGGAFVGCTSLTSITIPDSVTSIGDNAFSGCTSLTSITIPDSVTEIGGSAFSGCTSLTSITIPDGVTSIGSYAFASCSSLTSITIPDSVTSIGEMAIYECTSLESVHITDIAAWCGITFAHPLYYAHNLYLNGELVTDLVIPDSVTSIGNYAFSYCTSLTSVTIPDSVTSIGGDAFSGCTSLTSFQGKLASEDGHCLIIKGVLNSFVPAGLTEYTIPDSVTSIGGAAFEDCSSLTSITIPDSVTEIGDGAFNGCTGELIINSKIVEKNYSSDNYPQKYGWLSGAKFTKLTIGDSVTSIGDYAFYDCDSLTSIAISDSVTSIGKRAFSYCTSLTSFQGKLASEDGRCLIIDGELKYVAPAGLTEYSIPDSVTSIGDYAFYRCYSLKSITIPDSVTSIGGSAFQACISLKSITIPARVTLIGSYAFDGCNSLKEVYCKRTTPPWGGEYMFSYNASGRKIYVPRASVEAYKAKSYWSAYKSYIYGYDF